VKPPQIYFIKRWDSRLRKQVMTPQVSIDGLRLIAQRSRAYGGATPYLYAGPDGAWKEFWDSDAPPSAAKVGVKRRGWTDWLWAVATWKEWAQYVDEYDRAGNKTGVQVLAPFWKTKPAHMLGKTAEAIALKRAFPEETDQLELASIDQEWHEQVAAGAKRYDEIFGNEETGTAFDIPEARALNASGETVDTNSGEVLMESEPAAPPSVPDRSAMWAENRELVARAQELQLTGVPTLNQRIGNDALAAANEELRQRIGDRELDQRLAAEQAQASFT
jgi:hypothetical protein